MGSNSPRHPTISNVRSRDLRADCGPATLQMAVRSARSSLEQHCPTSEPYRAAGKCTDNVHFLLLPNCDPAKSGHPLGCFPKSLGEGGGPIRLVEA